MPEDIHCRYSVGTVLTFPHSMLEDSCSAVAPTSPRSLAPASDGVATSAAAVFAGTSLRSAGIAPALSTVGIGSGSVVLLASVTAAATGAAAAATAAAAIDAAVAAAVAASAVADADVASVAAAASCYAHDAVRIPSAQTWAVQCRCCSCMSETCWLGRRPWPMASLGRRRQHRCLSTQTTPIHLGSVRTQPRLCCAALT